MPQRYIITIGGSGVKCMEALIHAGAAGIMNGEINIMHLDPDIDNGNITKTLAVLEDYRKNKLQFESSMPIFPTDFKTVRNDPLEVPIPLIEGTKKYYDTIDEYFNENENLSLYYTTGMRKMSWGKGFRGMPSLGAPVVAGALDWKQEPWNTFGRQIERNINNGVRIFLIGSIFGGTGASIFPTIAKLFYDRFGQNENFKIGGALLFPYFTFIIPSGFNDLCADPKNFLLSSKLHLQYYSTLGELNPFKRIYIIGENDQHHKSLPFATGSTEQLNPPHHVELLAVLAAKDFFTEDSKAFGPDVQYKYLSRDDDAYIGWDDIPDKENVQNKLLTMTTMACSFLDFWLPLFCRQENQEFQGTRWFDKHIGSDPGFSDKLAKLKKYFESYLLWVLGLHIKDFSPRGKRTYKQWILDTAQQSYNEMHLFNFAALKAYLNESANDAHLANLKWRPQNSKDSGYYTPKIDTPYDFLWEEASKIKSQSTVPLENLITVMHAASEKFIEKNYAYIERK